jgi:hypothetical protein
MKQKRVGFALVFLLGAWAVNGLVQHVAHLHNKEFSYFETFMYAMLDGLLIAFNAVLVAMLIRNNSNPSLPDAYKWVRPSQFKFFATDLFFMVWFISAGVFMFIHAYVSSKFNHQYLVLGILYWILAIMPYSLGTTVLFIFVFDARASLEEKIGGWADSLKKNGLWIGFAVLAIVLLYVAVGDLFHHSKLLTDGTAMYSEDSSSVSNKRTDVNVEVQKKDAAPTATTSEKGTTPAAADPNASLQQQLADALKNGGTATASTPGATAMAPSNGQATATTTANESNKGFNGDGDH